MLLDRDKIVFGGFQFHQESGKSTHQGFYAKLEELPPSSFYQYTNLHQAFVK